VEKGSGAPRQSRRRILCRACGYGRRAAGELRGHQPDVFDQLRENFWSRLDRIEKTPATFAIFGVLDTLGRQ
jgi:hypothetical protein